MASLCLLLGLAVQSLNKMMRSRDRESFPVIAVDMFTQQGSSVTGAGTRYILVLGAFASFLFFNIFTSDLASSIALVSVETDSTEDLYRRGYR